VQRVPGILRAPLGAAINATPTALVDSLLSRGSSWAPNTRARLLRELKHESPAQSYTSLLARWVSPAQVMSASHASIADERGNDAWPQAASEAEARMAYDMLHYMPDDILVKVDRSAMACSLETRAPLLDHRVVSFAAQQPLGLKIRAGRGKFLLRNLLARYIPAAMIDRPKQGFDIPLAQWLRGPLRAWGDATLANDAVLRDWFEPDVVTRLWTAHQRGENHAERLWPLLVTMQWLRAQ
ncbi:MAG: asparagine synthase C-terminal domain-containing protein, partial [Gemmatimonadaceae bacterium]